MLHCKIAHLTSAHPRYDTRIFVKMCCSLSEKYDVYLIVADGQGNEYKNNIHIIDAGKTTGGRISRMTSTVNNVFHAAIKIDAAIYHLHDPELIPIGLKLIKSGKKVIFDAHEDLPVQIFSKPYLSTPAKILLSKLVSLMETVFCARFSAVITATPYIRDKFLRINSKTVDINNFPLLEEFCAINYTKKQNEIVYIGELASTRGIKEIVQSLRFTNNITLNIAGHFSETETETAVKNLSEWKHVNYYGFLNRQQISELLQRSKIGLVTLHPTENYRVALPVKMFEYMASGLPVIASDFPLWKDIIEKHECGICVDPLDPKAIGNAINLLMNQPEVAEEMGQRGRLAALSIYNWNSEKNKLFDLYDDLLDIR